MAAFSGVRIHKKAPPFLNEETAGLSIYMSPISRALTPFTEHIRAINKLLSDGFMAHTFIHHRNWS